MFQVTPHKETSNLEIPEIIIFGIIALVILQKTITPQLIQLQADAITLVHTPLFYPIFFIFLLTALFFTFIFIKKRNERLAQEEIEKRLFWKQMKAEEEKQKELIAHLEYKQVPLFVPEYSSWTWERKERVDITVDLEKFFYKRRSLNKHEIVYLLKENYQPLTYKSICTGNYEQYIVKPRFNESLHHIMFIYDISEYLTKRKIKHTLFTTRMPDIVMYIGKHDIALEIETGTVIRNMNKFREKIRLLKGNYEDDYYFIVTNRNLIKKYRNYGKVIDPRYVKGQLDKIIQNAQK